MFGKLPAIPVGHEADCGYETGDGVSNPAASRIPLTI